MARNGYRLLCRYRRPVCLYCRGRGGAADCWRFAYRHHEGYSAAHQRRRRSGNDRIRTRLDGASLRYPAPMEFPAFADFSAPLRWLKPRKSIGATTHVGVTASSDTFYPGRERYDTYSGRVVRRFKALWKSGRRWA